EERSDREQDSRAGEDPFHFPVGTSLSVQGKPDGSGGAALVPGVGPRSIEPGQRSPWPVVSTPEANAARPEGSVSRLLSGLEPRMLRTPFWIEPSPTTVAIRLAAPLAS